jgi:hypothetical protein
LTGTDSSRRAVAPWAAAGRAIGTRNGKLVGHARDRAWGAVERRATVVPHQHASKQGMPRGSDDEQVGIVLLGELV